MGGGRRGRKKERKEREMWAVVGRGKRREKQTEKCMDVAEGREELEGRISSAWKEGKGNRRDGDAWRLEGGGKREEKRENRRRESRKE